ncbi:MAG TPA: Uma2 family endonuclease [Gemmataceae bacterium]|nr:Uma2 family endonuclease [Gemmataceae bacterium]
MAATAYPSPTIDYPTSDGRPMAETDLHRELMFETIHTLQWWFAADKMAYVSGNLLVFYEPGNRRRHLAPDVFVVKGVPNRKRNHYLIWEEGKGLDAVIELTSQSTREEDIDDKKWLYRDVLRVGEYFLFDPRAEYLNPPLQGFRLVGGDYVPIEPVEGRLPSEVLGLHLERQGTQLRFWNPVTNQYLPTMEERERQQAEAVENAELQIELKEKARQEADKARVEAEKERNREMEARKKLEEELARLRSQLGGGKPKND